MRRLLITSTLALLTNVWSMVGAQDYPAEYLGLPGDNLNLYATMKLFQESETLESFEKNLNDENSRINNLDLNSDNYIDYIMVIDYVDGDIHTIVLRAALNEDETQDVAVFTVQRFRDGSVQVQLVGDEALYGRNYIIEPIYAESGETPNPGYMGNYGNNRNVAVVRTTTYEVAAWPVVRYIYLPTYVSWHSLWRWGYYPSYWRPWRPFYWHTYYGYHYHWHNHYYRHYRVWNHNRCNVYNNFYYNKIRTYSVGVNYRISSGHYHSTYSRPDLRKYGDVLYTRSNRVTNTRTRDNVSVSGRRSANSESIQRRSIENGRAGIEKSSTTQATRRPSSGTAVKRGNESYRTSTAVSTSRNIERNSSGRVMDNPRREETNTISKSAEITNNRAAKSTSVGRSYGQSTGSSAGISSRNMYSTREAPRSVSSGGAPRQNQPKQAVSSGNTYGRPGSAVSTRSSSNRSGAALSTKIGSNSSGSAVSNKSSSNRSGSAVSTRNTSRPSGSSVSTKSSSNRSGAAVSSRNSSGRSGSAVSSGNSGGHNRSTGTAGNRDRSSSSGNQGRR